MTNKEIAQKITDIGKMLEILDANSFKITAYERASRMISNTSRSLEDIYKSDGLKGLQEINSIGKSISEKIEEYIKTGKISYHDELKKKVLSAILEFSDIPGVGPKTAKKLYETLKVENTRELKKALKDGKAPEVFKEKTRAKILDGINIKSQLSGRMLLSFAEPIAEDIIATLKKYPEVINADPVGSLRRMKETVGDIDLVASLKDKKSNASSIIDRFCKENFVKKVVTKGDTKTTIIDKNDISIDLEILPSDEYGSLLQHFTGSKDHNVAFRTYAEKHGFSISEHGIKVMSKSKRMIKCKTEKEVYNTLKMDYIEPELREDNGEIDMALKHKLPKLVELADIKGDLQMHSTFSDGENSITEMAQVCKKLGYEYMAITDHPSTLGITQGVKPKDIDKYITETRESSKKAGIKIFAGIEANIRPNGSIDLPKEILEKLDIVIASVHSSFRQDKSTATKRLIKAIENPFVKVIAHPSGRIINRRPGIDVDWSKVFRACKKTSTVLEVNSYPDRLDLKDNLIHEAIKNGVKIIINTDSHSVKHLSNMRYGLAQARRGWAEKKDIINTLDLKRFSQVLNIHK